MTNKNGFEKTLRLRIWRTRAVLALMVVYMIVVGETGGGDSRMQTRLAEDVSRLLFFGSGAALCVYLFRLHRLRRDRLLRKEQQIRESDERNQMIYDKSGGWVMNAVLVMLLFATTTASMYSMPAFYACYPLLLAAALLKGGAYLYYSRKL